MYRKIAAAAAAAVAVAGVGTAALATSGSTGTSGTGSTASAHSHHRHALRAMLRHVLHAEVTTKGKDGYITHSAVRGALTRVTPTAITVRAADGYTRTFTLTAQTRVREHHAGQQHATTGSRADLKAGDQVAVVGKAPEQSTAAPDATVVIDGVRK